MIRHKSCIEMIRQLVASPSVSSVRAELDQSNKNIIDILSDWLAMEDFQIEILPVDITRQKYNLIATKGYGKGGLVLAGHTDTVPTDSDLWSSDPFQLTEKDGKFYGLGTCDMKSFLALAIEASKMFSPDQLKEPLIIVATADEESTMSGAQALLKAGKPKARSAIIGEPTGNRPIRMHKGVMMERIRVTGQAGHSSNPALGKNAIEGMQQILSELIEFRHELQSQYHNALFEVPVPTLNMGHIHGGDNPNRICGQCALDIDIRPLPGMGLEELRSMLNQRLQRCLHNTGFLLEVTPLFHGTPALETDANCQLVKCVESLTDQRSDAVAFATEGPYLQALGMDVVIMGPGRIEQAHQANEYLERASIEPTISLLQQLINKHCVVGHLDDKR